MTTYKKLLKDKDGNGIIPVTDGDVEVVGTTTGNFNYAWKFLDGRLICFQRYHYSGNMNTAWGSCYSSGPSVMTPANYAVPFIAPPAVSATLAPQSGSNINCWLTTGMETGLGSTTKPPAYQCVRPSSATGASGDINIVAYGFWK